MVDKYHMPLSLPPHSVSSSCPALAPVPVFEPAETSSSLIQPRHCTDRDTEVQGRGLIQEDWPAQLWCFLSSSWGYPSESRENASSQKPSLISLPKWKAPSSEFTQSFAGPPDQLVHGFQGLMLHSCSASPRASAGQDLSLICFSPTHIPSGDSS